MNMRPVRLAYQPPTNRTFLSEQTSQRYFFSQNKPAPAISHQPNEQADGMWISGWFCWLPTVLFSQNKLATSNQPAVLFLQEQTSHQQPASGTFSLRTNQPPAKRTGRWYVDYGLGDWLVVLAAI
jgi:hypothetical protein